MPALAIGDRVSVTITGTVRKESIHGSRLAPVMVELDHDHGGDCNWYSQADCSRLVDRQPRATAAALLSELRQELTDIAGDDWECRRCGATIGIDHDTDQVPHASTCILAVHRVSEGKEGERGT